MHKVKQPSDKLSSLRPTNRLSELVDARNKTNHTTSQIKAYVNDVYNKVLEKLNFWASKEAAPPESKKSSFRYVSHVSFGFIGMLLGLEFAKVTNNILWLLIGLLIGIFISLALFAIGRQLQNSDERSEIANEKAHKIAILQKELDLLGYLQKQFAAVKVV